MCMRASGASELRKFWHFHILKLLFLSIFGRHIENKPWLKFIWGGGGGGQAPPLAPPPPPPHQYASACYHRHRAGSNNALHCTCVHVRTTYNEERFINVWNVSTQGGISLLNYVYIGYIIPYTN